MSSLQNSSPIAVIEWLLRTNFPTFTLTYTDQAGNTRELVSNELPVKSEPVLESETSLWPVLSPDTTLVEVDVESNINSLLIEWGLNPTTPKVHEIAEKMLTIVKDKQFSGETGKRVSTALMTKLFPNRRRMYPYSLGRCPSNMWPSVVTYRDPGHLAKKERETVLAWAYFNPQHKSEHLKQAHQKLLENYKIELRPALNHSIKHTRKSLKKALAINKKKF